MLYILYVSYRYRPGRNSNERNLEFASRILHGYLSTSHLCAYVVPGTMATYEWDQVVFEIDVMVFV